MTQQLPEKPRYGEPCNGCGLCCMAELCHVADVAFPGASAPCPALKLSDDESRTVCAFVEVEQAHGLPDIVTKGLGIGLGCLVEDTP